jgi:alkylhydroperoxidase family enzyme
LGPRSDAWGYLGEFFAVAGHQPAALLAFHEFTEALKRALPPELTEVVALTTATELGNDYERSQHERLSVNLGFPPRVDSRSRRACGERPRLAERRRQVRPGPCSRHSR